MDIAFQLWYDRKGCMTGYGLEQYLFSKGHESVTLFDVSGPNYIVLLTPIFVDARSQKQVGGI